MKVEKSVFGDSKRETLLDKFRVTDPEILCKSGNKIVKICLNPNCKVALQCGQYFCNHCGINVHQTCPSFPLEVLTHTLNSQAGSFKNLISNVADIDNQLISAIQESKKELTASYQVLADVQPDEEQPEQQCDQFCIAEQSQHEHIRVVLSFKFSHKINCLHQFNPHICDVVSIVQINKSASLGQQKVNSLFTCAAVERNFPHSPRPKFNSTPCPEHPSLLFALRALQISQVGNFQGFDVWCCCRTDISLGPGIIFDFILGFLTSHT